MGSSETTKEGHVMGTNEATPCKQDPGWIIIILSKLGRVSNSSFHPTDSSSVALSRSFKIDIKGSSVQVLALVSYFWALLTNLIPGMPILMEK